MSAERRAALVAWAKDRGALILEDDYDAEYRYDREPIGALHGLAPEQVIYAGSASKTLAPGLRLGWMLVPPRLVEPIAVTKEHVDRGSPSLEQLAFADFLSRGEFDHHLRRMRRSTGRPTRRPARRDATRPAELRPVGRRRGLHVRVAATRRRRGRCRATRGERRRRRSTGCRATDTPGTATRAG